MTLRLIVVLLFSALITGCNSFGAKTIKGSRLQYNNAVQSTNTQQMLLNLVRLRHQDTVFFIDVSAITSTASVSASTTASIAKSFSAYSIIDTLAFTEAPVVSYTPVQGSNYVNELLAPLSLEQFVILSRAGWDVNRLMKVSVKNIVNSHNQANGDNKEFDLIVRLLEQLENKHLMQFDTIVKSGITIPVIHFKSKALAETEEGRQLKQILRLDDSINTYFLSDNIADEDKSNVIAIKTRSLMGIMDLLATSVDKSKSQLCKVDSTDIFNVCYGKKKPKKQLFTKIHYNGEWFYIVQQDRQSKLTMSLLSHIFAMKSGTTLSSAPTVTIPAN